MTITGFLRRIFAWIRGLFRGRPAPTPEDDRAERIRELEKKRAQQRSLLAYVRRQGRSRGRADSKSFRGEASRKQSNRLKTGWHRGWRGTGPLPKPLTREEVKQLSAHRRQKRRRRAK